MSEPLNRTEKGSRLALRLRALRLSWRGSDDVVALFRSAWVQMLSVGINAGQSILLPLMMGPATFGLFAGIYTNMMVAVGIGRGPIEMLIQRGHAHGPDHSTLIYRRQALCRVFLAGLLSSLIMFIGLSAVQRWDISGSLYLFLTLTVGIGAASGLRRGLLVSTNRTSELEVLDMVARPTLFLAAAGLSWWLGLLEPLLLWLLGASFVLVLTWPNLKAARATAVLTEGNDSAFRPWSYLMASSGLSILVKNVDVIILAMFLDDATVGRYYIVARIADLAAFGYSFAAGRFVHRFAAARRLKDWDGVSEVVRRATLFGIAIAGATSAGIIVIAPHVLPLIDPALSDYLLPLAMLLLAQIFNATLGVRGAFLNAIEPRHTLGIKLLLNPIAIVAMVLAVPSFGMVGAAAVTTIFCIAMQTTNSLALRRVMATELRGS